MLSVYCPSSLGSSGPIAVNSFVVGHVENASLSRAGNSAPTGDGMGGNQRTGRSAVCAAAQFGLLNQRRQHFNKILL